MDLVFFCSAIGYSNLTICAAFYKYKNVGSIFNPLILIFARKNLNTFCMLNNHFNLSIGVFNLYANM